MRSTIFEIAFILVFVFVCFFVALWLELRKEKREIKLDPPYAASMAAGRYSKRHEHFDKAEGRWSFDAVEDDLGRFFVWDGDTEKVVAVCKSYEEACALAAKLAKGV